MWWMGTYCSGIASGRAQEIVNREATFLWNGMTLSEKSLVSPVEQRLVGILRMRHLHD